RTQTEAIDAYDLLVLTCADIGQAHADETALREAVEVAEASRARNLMELLADETLQPANAPAAVVEEYRELRRRLRQAERLLREQEEAPQDGGRRAAPAGSTDPVRQEAGRLQAEHQRLLQRIQTDFDREFNPDQPVTPLAFEAIRELLPADVPTAIVQYSVTAERGLALIVTRDEVFSVSLPDLSERQAEELAGAWFRAYAARYDAPADRNLMLAPLDSQPATAGGWDTALPALLRPVAERAVWPVAAALLQRGIGRLLLCPHRALHVFPLHACRLPDGRY